jgi:hypothetical protein
VIADCTETFDNYLPKKQQDHFRTLQALSFFRTLQALSF